MKFTHHPSNPAHTPSTPVLRHPIRQQPRVTKFPSQRIRRDDHYAIGFAIISGTSGVGVEAVEDYIAATGNAGVQGAAEAGGQDVVLRMRREGRGF